MKCMPHLYRFFFIGFLTLLSHYSYAQIIASEEIACAPFEIEFSHATPLTTYYWSFGNNSFSTDDTPTSIYNDPGTYNVQLFDGQGGSLIANLNIEILEKIDIQFSNKDTICTSNFANFIDNTILPANINVTERLWNFGDGQGNSSLNTTHNYEDPGCYDVTLQLKTNIPSCDRLKTEEDFICVEELNFNATDVDIFANCVIPVDVDLSMSATSSEGYSINYEWEVFNYDLPIGQQKIATYNQADLTHTITESGRYAFFPDIDDGNKCFRSLGSAIYDIGFSSMNMELTDTLTDELKDTICNNFGYRLSINNPGEYTPSFTITPPTSFTLSPENDSSYLIQINEPGNYVLTGTVETDDDCDASDNISIYIPDVRPDFTADLALDVACGKDGAVSFTIPTPFDDAEYTWTMYDGTEVLGTSASAVFNQTSLDLHQVGNYGEWIFPRIRQDPTAFAAIDNYDEYKNASDPSFQYTIMYNLATELKVKRDGCVDSLTRIDTVFDPLAFLEVNKHAGCVPFAVNFSDLSFNLEKLNGAIVSWDVDYDDGTTENFTTYPGTFPHSYTSAGTYYPTITVTTDKGCARTSPPLQIKVGNEIEPTFTTDINTTCRGESVKFTNTSSSEAEEVYFGTDDFMPTHCPKESIVDIPFRNSAGLEDVTMYTVSNGCVQTKIFNDFITVQGTDAYFEYKIACDDDFTIYFDNLSSSNSNSFNWDFGDGATSSLKTPSHTYTSTGDYDVTLITDNGDGCIPDTFSTSLSIEDLFIDFEIQDTTICNGGTINVDASNSSNYFTETSVIFTWISENDAFMTKSSRYPIDSLVVTKTGIHPVKLVLSDSHGCKDTLSKNIFVSNPQPELTSDDELICFPDTNLLTSNFRFHDSLHAPLDTSYWSLGDGFEHIAYTADTSFNNIYNFDSFLTDQDSFWVSVEFVDTLGCRGIDSLQVDIYDIEARVYELYVRGTQRFIRRIENTSTAAEVCLNDSLVLYGIDDTENGDFSIRMDYYWILNGGRDTITELSGPNISEVTANVFDTPGLLIDTMLLIEQESQCQAKFPFYIDVQDAPPTGISLGSAIDNSLPNPICFPRTIEMSFNQPITNELDEIEWEIISPTGIITNYTSDISRSTVHDFTEKGTYKVYQRVFTNIGCSSLDSISFEMIGPEGNIELDKNVICIGDTISFSLVDTADLNEWTWDFGDGFTAQNVIDTFHQYNLTPQDTVLNFDARVLLKGNDQGCPIVIDTTIYVIKPKTRITSDDPQFTCTNKEIDLTLDDLLKELNGDQLSYDYEWSTQETGSTITIDTTLKYYVTATETSLGCSSTDSIDIGIDTAIVIVDPIKDFTRLTCDTPQIDISLDTDVPNTEVSFKWSTNEITRTISVTEPDSYTVTTTNLNNDCTVLDTIPIDQNIVTPTFNLDSSLDTLTCIDTIVKLYVSDILVQKDSSILWNTTANQDTITAQTGGKYFVDIKDTENGCIASDTIIIIDNKLLPVASTLGSRDSLNCATNLATIVGSNSSSTGFSTGPLSYNWDNTVVNFTNPDTLIRSLGLFILTVTDESNGCIDTAHLNIVSDCKIFCSLTLSATELNCNNDSLNILVEEDNPLHSGNESYSWSTNPLDILDSLTVREKGTYTLTYTDPDLTGVGVDTATCEIEILQDTLPPNISIFTTDPNIDCMNSSVIINSIATTQGTQSFVWNDTLETTNSSYTYSAVGDTILIDTIIAKIIDSDNGCINIDSIIINENTIIPNPTLFVSDTIINCLVDTIELAITDAGSQLGATYLWSQQGVTDSNIIVTESNVLGTSIYEISVIVTDTLNNCITEKKQSIENDIITPSVVINRSSPNINCKIDEITLAITPTTSPSDYSYEWINNGVTVSTTDEITISQQDTLTYNVLDTVNKCTFTDEERIYNDTFQPIPVVVFEDLSCYTQTTDISARQSVSQNRTNSSFQSLTFLWSENAQIENTIEVNRAEVYTVTVTDTINKCSAIDSIDLTDFNDPPQLISLDTILPSCNTKNEGTYNDGALKLDIAGNDPSSSFTYSLLDTFGILSQFSSSTNSSNYSFENLTSDYYSIEVFDSFNGCTLTIDTVLNQPNSFTSYIDIPPTRYEGGTYFVLWGEGFDLEGRVVPDNINYTYNWKALGIEKIDIANQEHVSHAPLTSDAYVFSATDEKQCTDRDSVFIAVKIDKNIYVPNAFTPNGDGVNDIFQVHAGQGVIQVYDLVIADRWGGIVYQQNTEEITGGQQVKIYGWDGLIKGEEMPTAVYVYHFKALFQDGTVTQYKGDVTLIR